MSTTSIILDFETLDTAPTAAVTEIGCIAVNRSDFTCFESLDLRPAIIPQLATGRSIDDSTIRWHLRKGTFPKQDNPSPLEDCVRTLAALIAHHKPYRIWAWGKDFERPLYENLCRSLRITIPDYQFRLFTCARDVWQHAHGNDTRPPERTHHAHQDCKDELRDLHTALTKLNLTHVF